DIDPVVAVGHGGRSVDTGADVVAQDQIARHAGRDADAVDGVSRNNVAKRGRRATDLVAAGVDSDARPQITKTARARGIRADEISGDGGGPGREVVARDLQARRS